MSSSKPNTTLETARASIAKPLTFQEFLAKLSPKDRGTAERRVTVLEAAADQAQTQTWQRLACTLMTLAPFAAKLVGKQTLQLYIADGKYRMQVFALEDLQDGVCTVYCPDILDEAIELGLLKREHSQDPDEHILEPSKEVLNVKRLDKTALNPAVHFKDMVGWNRKALRITLPLNASPAQIETAELMCAIASQHFVHRPAPEKR